MKTISLSGNGVKSKPVSLSKAAKYLSKFVDSDSGASEANLGFLKRASAAFNELNAFHKEIKKATSRSSGGVDADADENVKNEGDVSVDDVRKERKKKEKRKKNGVMDGDGVEVDGRKRKKLDDGEDAKFEDSAERKSKKRRKKNRERDE